MSFDEKPLLDALAIAAHPDDVELSIGGTLVRLANAGYKIGILDLTRGEAGTRGTPEIRSMESTRAARLLGLSLRENLNLGDSHIWVNEESRIKLVRALRRIRPRVVFTQYWEDPHPDHSHASLLVREAAHLSGVMKYDRESGQDRWRPSGIAYFLFPRTVSPSFIVDISDSRDQKWKAIQVHASQFFNPKSDEPQSRVSSEKFLQEVDARDRYFGALIGAQYGEAFFVREALNVADPIEQLSRQMNMYQ